MNVSDAERLSRFLLFSKWFSPGSSRVKADAFIPHPRVDLSVSCTEGLSDDTVWGLGIQVVEARPDNVTLYGRGDLQARDVRGQGLEVERNDQPQYHANIVGWPSEGKDAQRMKAIELAAAAKLVLRNSA